MKKQHFILCAGAILLLSSCKSTTVPTLSFSAMDTAVSIHCIGSDAAQAQSKLKETVLSCDELLSKTNKDSDISKINREHDVSLSELSDVTVSMLSRSDQIVSMTNGTFDPSLGNLISLWGIGTDRQQVPSETKIQQALTNCGWDKVSLSETKITIPYGLSLDFGAIAKGAVTDRLRSVLSQYDLDGAVISLGGNVLVSGRKEDGSLWKVGISDPEKQSDYIGYLTITDTAVVTSGNYERYFESNGIRYHHILDPNTGFPADSGLSSVTVISSDATMADGLSTALFVMGVTDGLPLVEQTDNLEAVFITQDGTVFCSSGIKSSFTLTETDRFRLDPS